ncbi:MAG: PAS domain-containing sensor histidine kinase, partial [Chloroflexota bacterium]|nr:PAS domain-containing sensor histidine kinase [Chloroflexota bacterium]
LTTDARSRVEFWSPGAESVFGWSADEIVGESVEITFTPDDRAAGVPEQEFTTARDTGYAPDVRWHMRRDGTRVFIDGSSRARRSNTGRFAGVLKIGQDVTERRREDEARSEAEERYRQELEARVQEATADLRRLSRQLITVQEEERRRLALELHDEIGQMLTGLGLQLGSRATLTDSDLDDARRAIQELTEQVRQMSMDLRPPALDRYGLMPSITWLLERFQHRTGITVELVQAGAEGRFPATVEITAYRIVQESLTNIARHARTPEASINLVADAQSLVVTIRDEGIGFLPDAVRQGSGLGGMRERVALIGGTLIIESRPDAGTTITAILPIAPDLPVPADAGPNPGSGSED